MAYLLAAFQNSTPLTRFRLSTSLSQTDVIDDIKYPLNPTSRVPIVGTITKNADGESINCPDLQPLAVQQQQFRQQERSR